MLACNFSADVTLQVWAFAASRHITHVFIHHWDLVREGQLETGSGDRSLCFPKVNVIFFVLVWERSFTSQPSTVKLWHKSSWVLSKGAPGKAKLGWHAVSAACT